MSFHAISNKKLAWRTVARCIW